MDSDTGYWNSEIETPDIEWRVASVDTVLFNLLDRLKRDKRALATRERPHFGIVAFQRRAKGPRFA